MHIAIHSKLKEVVIGFERAPVNQMRVSVDGETITQIGHVWDPDRPLGLAPEVLRDAFLEVKTLEQAVSFLQICGPFLDRQRGNETQDITWKEFQGFQDVARKQMLGLSFAGLPKLRKRLDEEPPATQINSRADWEWFTDPDIVPTRRNDRVYFRFMCWTALETIGASIFADKIIRGAAFKECPVCSKLFEVITVGGHEKRYCTPEHSRRAARERARGNA